jgi:hypothetical protein
MLPYNFDRKQVALLSAFAVLTASAPISSRRPPISDFAVESLSATACAHPGNADFYGLGIRLGIYLQIFSTMLCMIDPGSSDALYDAHDSNAILLLAVFVAVVKSTPSRSIELVDVIILLRIIWLIIVCGFSVAHLTQEYKRAKEAKKMAALITTPSALAFRILVVGLVSIYNVWFWFHGVTYFQHASTCRTYAFFFAKLAADGRLQGFYKFASVVIMLMPPSWLLAYAALIVALMVLILAISMFILGVVYAVAIPVALPFLGFAGGAAVYATLRQPHPMEVVRKSIKQICRKLFSWKGIKHVLKMYAILPIAAYTPAMQEIADKWTKIRQREDKPNKIVKRAGTLPLNPAKNKVSTGWTTYLVLLVVYYIFSIIGIEMTIYWNHVDGSYDIGSTGQLIPFIIGILTSVKVFAHVLSSGDGEAYKAFQRLKFFSTSVFLRQHQIKRRWSFDTSQQREFETLSSVQAGRRRPRRKPLKRASSLPQLRQYDASKDKKTSPSKRAEINKWLRNHPQRPSEERRVESIIKGFRHNPQRPSEEGRTESIIKGLDSAMQNQHSKWLI